MSNRLAWLVLALALLLPELAAAQAPGGLPWETVPQRTAQRGNRGPVLMYYGVEVVSNYVFRGDDMYVRKFTRDGKEHGAFNVAPAVRPQITLFSPTITFNVVGTFAYDGADRADDLENEKGPYYGLEREDEIDYTLAYRWRNELGRFTAGITLYSFLDEGRVGPTSSQPPLTPKPNPTEMYLGWDAPFWPRVNPNVYHYAGQEAGEWYTAFSFDGAVTSRFAWLLNLGFVRVGPKDITAQVRWDVGPLTFTLGGAHRPEPKTLSYRGANGYDKEGEYIVDPSKSDETAAYPKTIYWIGINVGGRLRGKG